MGSDLADTLGRYLQMAARLRERDVLVDWVQKQMPADAGLDTASCAAIQSQAASLVGRGRAGEAVAMLQALIQRLETEGLAGGEEVAFQLGTSYACLGEIFFVANRQNLAFSVSRRAMEILERVEGNDAKGNLSAALVNLANACRALGRYEEAFVHAKRGLEINRLLGHHRNVVVGLGQCAQIRAAQQRWAEAEALYGEALEQTRQIGDLEYQGICLQNRGILRGERGDQERAFEDYEEAIRLFQQAGNAVGEMRTCNQLACSELLHGQLEAAEAWCCRARELALALGDQYQLGAIAQNLGILYQTRAQQATGAERAEWLRRALVSVEESLGIKLGMEDEVGASSSYCQLGVLHRLIGNFDAAAENTLRGLEVFEELGLPDVWKVYGDLAAIAAARGDSAAAAEWSAKRDAKFAEVERLRAGLPALV